MAASSPELPPAFQAAYFTYGTPADFTLDDGEIEKSTEVLKNYPTPQDMKSV